MRPGDKRAFGLSMEEVVAQYLEDLGIRVLARNLRLGYLELDLVALDRRTVAVVEVRYRGPGAWTSAFGSIDAQKRARLRRAGFRLWRQRFRHNPAVDHLRFDAATVSLDNSGAPQVQYCRAAF